MKAVFNLRYALAVRIINLPHRAAFTFANFRAVGGKGELVGVRSIAVIICKSLAIFHDHHVRATSPDDFCFALCSMQKAVCRKEPHSALQHKLVQTTSTLSYPPKYPRRKSFLRQNRKFSGARSAASLWEKWHLAACFANGLFLQLM